MYARRQKLSEEAIEYATAVKVDAMTLMGEMLRSAEKNHGAKGNPGGRGAKVVRSQPGTTQLVPPPKLADLGISKKESATAQALATLKEKAPELHEKVKAGETTVAKVTPYYPLADRVTRRQT